MAEDDRDDLAGLDPSRFDWRKSSWSDTDKENDECVEVALIGDQVLVRDSKRPSDRSLQFTRVAWNEFLDGLAVPPDDPHAR